MCRARSTTTTSGAGPRPYRIYAELLRRGGGLATVAEAHRRIWTRSWRPCPTAPPALVVGHGGGIEPGLVACLPDAENESWGAPSGHCDGARLGFDDGRFVSVQFRPGPAELLPGSTKTGGRYRTPVIPLVIPPRDTRHNRARPSGRRAGPEQQQRHSARRLSTLEMPGRVVDDSDEYRETGLLDLEVREDGGLRLVCGGASRPMSPAIDPLEIVMDLVIVGLTKRLVIAAATVAETADFSGGWDLGITVIGLSGLRRHRGGSFDWDAAPYSEDDYRQTTRATYEQLTQQPASVVEELTGRLHRGLGGGPEIVPF